MSNSIYYSITKSYLILEDNLSRQLEWIQTNSSYFPEGGYAEKNSDVVLESCGIVPC